MANSSLVLQASTDVISHPNSSFQIRPVTSLARKQRETKTSSPQEKAKVTGMLLVRQALDQYKLSERSINIIMSSWRETTKQQYSSYISQWLHFCGQKQIDPLQTNVKSGRSYSCVNTARSALSSLIMYDNGVGIGKHPLVVRFMSGVFNINPSVSRYQCIWDVSGVLQYLKSLSPVRDLSLKDLTLKIVMLIALVAACRVQTLALLSLSGMRKGKSGYYFTFDKNLKQSRPGYKNPVVKLLAYPVDRQICAVTGLDEYLFRTKDIRGSETALFISFIKPFKVVSKATLARWLRQTLKNSGIDTDVFKAHSVRVASTSKAKDNKVPVEDILNAAGWSSCTFAKYYDKNITTEGQFAQGVLV